ncbi:MAG: DNA alkylation repair protein [Polyangiaceae bacterium]|nr:DNA alkylation repair protein [Polyangiaceae bacterium]
MTSLKTKGGIDIPLDLATAVEADPKLLAMWQRLRPSCQREHVGSVLEAKRPETRRRRIVAVVKATVEWNDRHAPKTRRAGDERVPAILAELCGMGSERDRAGMARYGIRVDNAFGVSVYELRKLAKRLGTDHDLALALWATGNHEARLLACFVDDPAAGTAEQTETWAADFDSWDLCDQATTSLFDQTPHAWPKAAEWAAREAEWTKRAGFALMAGLAVHDKTAGDRAFLKLLPLIERGASDDRNFVKKAVNWALRNIGKRNRALHAAAVASARRILAAANERAGGARGGDPSCRAARWVATDAIRELTSEKVRARLPVAVIRTGPATRAKPAPRPDLGAPVDAFFAKQPPHLRAILDELRRLVLEAAPDAAAALKWGMPWFTVAGKMMCSLGAHKAHVNLILVGPADAFADPEGRLLGSSQGGRHLKLTSLDELPRAAVGKWLRVAAKVARGQGRAAVGSRTSSARSRSATASGRRSGAATQPAGSARALSGGRRPGARP